MKKISGQIRNAISKEMRGVATLVAIPQPPIEGVKITDGNTNVFSGKDGKYEITTEKQFLTFTKENYVSQTMDLYEMTNKMPYQRDVFLEKSDGTTTETKSNSEEKNIIGVKKSRFFIGLGIVILVGVGLMVVIPKLKKR